jgi:hypothetical protein
MWNSVNENKKPGWIQGPTLIVPGMNETLK